ncbi:MAG: sugar phosphate isomerase/epimerase family protein [Anaerolineales bacterium]|jgi:sugar phosphate isomerase/epimerase
MKLALTIQTPEVPAQVPVALLSGTLAEKLKKAARMGATGVELITTEPTSLDVPGLQRQLDRNGLQAAAIASGGMAFAVKLTLLHSDPSISALACQRLDEMINLAAALHAPVVTVGSFRGRLVTDKERSLVELARILRHAGERAAVAGVCIALEPLNRFEGDLLNNVAQGLAFLEEVNQPAVGLLVDTFHVNIEESSWTEPFRQAAQAGKLFHVHLGDNNRLPPGHGLIDFKAILFALKESGYTGWLSAELLGKPDPDMAGEQTIDYMFRLMKEVAPVSASQVQA